MLRSIITATIISIVIMPAISSASAVLIDAQGKVDVTIAGRLEPARSGLELPDGSVVVVKKGSASVLLESGAVDEVVQGMRYTVGSEKASGRRTDLGHGITLAMKELAASGEGPTVHGMVKKVGGPRQVRIDFGNKAAVGQMGLYPTGTKVKLGHEMTFKWLRPVDYKNPALVLDNARKRRLAMANLRAGDTSFTRAASKLHLKDGESYSWFLAERKDRDVKGKTGRYSFSTISSADERALEGEMAKIRSLRMSEDGKKLLIAQLYFQHGLYYDMVNVLAPLYERSPSPFVKKLLRLGYSKMGNTGEVKKYE